MTKLPFEVPVTVPYYATPSSHGVIIIINSVCGGLTLAAPKHERTKQHESAPIQAHCLASPQATRLLDKGKEE